MGIQLRDLVHPTDLSLADLKGRRLAVDAYNMFYQFLATIRQADGQPFTDAQGAVTSHLVGLLYRTASLLEHGVLPVFVFDGRPSDMKAATLRGRAVAKAKAQAAWDEALAAGDLERAKKKAGATSRLTPPMAADARRLLDALGVPSVQAPSEGEAQAVVMARRGEVWSAASEDYDTLLFGTPRLIRGLSALKPTTRGDEPVVKSLETPKLLQELGISQEELILLGLLMGTDFNEGVAGYGPKKALKLVQEHLGYEATLRKVGVEPESLRPVMDLFLTPPTTSEYSLRWKGPDHDAVKALLIGEHGFAEDRVERTLRRIPSEAPRPVSGTQMSLESFGVGGP